VQKNLKSDSGYYNWNKRTLTELMRDAKKFGMKATMAERAAWGDMRMDATDIADVTGYALLMHGQPTAAGPTLAFQPGQRVRLRFINGSAMSFMDIRIPGVPMTIVAADGRPVQPVTVDEFRMGVAETYDVIVEPPPGAHALWVETLDRRASVLGRLTSDPTLTVAAPAARPKQVLLLAEMGHSMPAPGEACTAEHAAMGHCQLAGFAPHAPDGGPCSGGCVALFQGQSQGFFDGVCGHLLVLHSGKNAGYRGNGVILFCSGQLPDRDAQGLPGFVHPVQGQQNLQDVPVGFCGFGGGALPSLCRLQSRFARARLQGQIDGALEQCRIAGFACGVQDEGKPTARRAAAHVQFTQQQLVKQSGIECGLLRGAFVLERSRGACERLGRLRPSAPDASGDEGESKPEFHGFIIIQPPPRANRAA
jgi:hypothetical protein